MAIKKISEFVAGTPTSDSKILFEQNEKGKSCTIGDAVNTCVLSYEEIMATNPEPDLSGKVASASALKTLGTKVNYAWNTAQNSFKSLVSGVTVKNYARCLRFGNYFSIILPISVSSTVSAWTSVIQVPVTSAVEAMGLVVSASGTINVDILPYIPGDSNKIEFTNSVDKGSYLIHIVGAVKQ